jgi:hypothetical protein
LAINYALSVILRERVFFDVVLINLAKPHPSMLVALTPSPDGEGYNKELICYRRRLGYYVFLSQ